MAELETDQDLLNKQSTESAEETGGVDLLLCRPSSLVPVSQVSNSKTVATLAGQDPGVNI